MSRSAPVGAVRTHVADHTGWVTTSNPARRNALSFDMMAQLDAALRSLDKDRAVRVIVLRGEGDIAFTAGADLSDLAAQPGDAEAKSLGDKTVTSLFAGLSMLASPMVAMIHGHCLGAGVAIALGADLRFAAENSRFAIPAARLGIGYPVSLTQALARSVGPGHAADILFTGRSMTAREALDIGLVNRLVPAEELEAATRQLAETIAANAPLSVRAAKAAISALAHPDRRDEAETAVGNCVASLDAREGQRAFLEKRTPRFLGI